MQLILVALVLGIALGARLHFTPHTKQWIPQLINIGLVVLLFAMGAKIGSDRSIMNQLDEIGLKALVLAVGATLGSILLAIPVNRIFEKRLRSETGVLKKTRAQAKNHGGESF